MQNRYSHDVFISFSFKDQAIVDKITNQLNNMYNIKSWICTEEIHAGENFREDIVEAINCAKIVVLVQSKNSVCSHEVTKEILFALKKGKMVKPFLIEDCTLSDVMEMELSTTHYIDATRPTLDDRIRDLAKDICLTLEMPFAKANISTKNALPELLSTPSVIPKTVFCGREDTLSDIHNRFSNGERVLFLSGIGGIGKTQIAKQYAKQYRDDYDTIVYATYNKSLKELIVASAAFNFEPTFNRYTLSDGTIESDDSYFERKVELLKKVSNKRTLIIIDNFDVQNDDSLEKLTDGNYHLLITTRCDYSRFYPTVKIEPLSSLESLKEVFFKNYDSDFVDYDDPALIELIELVNRHTYTVELLALHMENSGQTPSEMIKALKENGISSLDEEVMSSDMQTHSAYKNLLKMFRLFSLTDEEQQVLRYLSLMPLDGVDIRDFKKWANLKSLKVINSLQNRSWIIKNQNGIALHPIIRSVITHEIEISDNTCEDFISRFCESISEGLAWSMKKRDKDKYSAIAENLIEAFPKITKKTELLYYNTEAILSFAVNPLLASELAVRLYDYYLENYGETHFFTGRAAYKIGWLYSYNRQLNDSTNVAIKWLQKADYVLSDIELSTTVQKGALSQTKVNLAKMYMISYKQTNDKSDYEKALQYGEKNINFCEKSYKKGDSQYPKIAGAYWQVADILLVGNELDKALLYIDKAIEILVDVCTEQNGDTMHATNRKAAILYAMGEYEKAKPLAKKSTEGYIEFFGENHPVIVDMYTLIGDCCLALHENSESKEAYEKALEIAKKIYEPNTAVIVDLEKKLS